MLYNCTLINNGYVQESFYREGESIKDVKEGLNMFTWPDGEWTITAADEDN